MILIGLNGKFRHGKSYVAKYIKEAAEMAGMSCEIVSFADPLKGVLRNEFGWDGKKDERGRRLLQTVGTEGARAYNPDIWVEKWVGRVEAVGFTCDVLIADDMRFGNESDAIHQLGGFTLRIVRLDGDGAEHREPGFEHLYAHPSELGLQCDHVARCNSGDFASLKNFSVAFLCDCKQKQEAKNG